MKLFALLLGAVLLVAAAQCAAQPVRSFGFKVGMASATQSFTYENHPSLTSLRTEHRWGFAAGVFARSASVSLFSLRLEIDYIQKGYKQEIPVSTPEFPDGTGETITVSPRADYLSVPLFLHVALDGLPASPYAFVGPRYDVVLQKNDITYLDANEVGMTIGAGIKLPFGRDDALLLEARVSPPIEDVYAGTFLHVRNSSVEVFAGMEF